MKTKLTLLIISLIFLMPGCKKGPNDPFLSFKCRKARVVGTWTVTSYKSTYSSSGGNTSTHIMTNGNYSDTYNSFTTTGVETFSYEFLKDGTWTLTNNSDGDLYTSEGTWNFTGKIGENKNKDHIVMMITKSTDPNSTQTYVGDEFDAGIFIDELRSKKMVWTSHVVYTDNGGASTFNSTSDDEWVLESK